MGKSSSDFCRTDIGRAGRVRWPIGRRGLPVTGPRVLLMQLSERTSAKGNRYLSGWLGKASVVAFQAEEPDKFGNPVWDVFVSEPQPRTERRPEAEQEPELRPRPEPSSRSGGTAAPDVPANPSARQRPETVTQRSPARHQPQGDGWRGSQYRRPANGARRAPAADDTLFYDDSLEDIGR